jgi:RNA polymerase-associated protein
LLHERLVSLAPVFDKSSYFLNDEFSLIDCYIAPLLLRLPKYGINLPDTYKAIKAYTKRIFSRPSFQASLSDIERELVEEYDFE